MGWLVMYSIHDADLVHHHFAQVSTFSRTPKQIMIIKLVITQLDKHTVSSDTYLLPGGLSDP